MPLIARQHRYRLRASAWEGLLPPALGGLALALAFPPWRIWPLIFLAWIPLWVTLAREADGPRKPWPDLEGSTCPPRLRYSWRRPFLQGWLMGVICFLIMLYWLLALPCEEMTIPGLMIPSLLLIGFYLGLFFGLAALCSSLLSRWSHWPLLAVVPIVTALFEFVRSLGPLGFPWGAPAYALARVTPLLQTGALVGFWGLNFLILVVGSLIAAGIRRQRWGLLAAVALVAVLWAYGEIVLARHPASSGDAQRSPLRVLVAQPDVRREIKWKPEKKSAVTRMVLEHGRRAARRGQEAGGFDLFVWPETVLPARLFNDAPLYQQVLAFVDSLRQPVLLGTQEGYWVHVLGKRQYICNNSAVLLRPGGGHSPIYRKMRLVPFSERMPLQKLAPWLGQLDFGQSNFYPGHGPVLAEIGDVRIGCLICFESAFPDLAHAYVQLGANLLVVITNDFWFGRTAGPMQHAEMSILRAVENRIPVVRCANTGISFLVDPWGRVTNETNIFTQQDFVGTVAVGAGSFAARHPAWAVKLLALGLLLVMVASARRWKQKMESCDVGR
ncbi:MAG: apolipoprotein N-acyltransferase [Candidatus Eisenbacteria sp.]|nr:apolipoprotein N-acyltransferase [Candidatus Eisenbacteria bacterium]